MWYCLLLYNLIFILKKIKDAWFGLNLHFNQAFHCIFYDALPIHFHPLIAYVQSSILCFVLLPVMEVTDCYLTTVSVKWIFNHVRLQLQYLTVHQSNMFCFVGLNLYFSYRNGMWWSDSCILCFMEPYLSSLLEFSEAPDTLSVYSGLGNQLHNMASLFTSLVITLTCSA